MGWYEHPHGGVEKFLQVLLAFPHFSSQLGAIHEFPANAREIVVVAMQHGFVTSLRYAMTQILHQGFIFLERMDRPGISISAWNALASPGLTERNNGQ